MKKNFALNERVVIRRTGSDLLDGVYGTILGTSMVNVTDMYIVLLDKETPTHKAIIMTESCLDRVQQDTSE